MAEKKKKGGTPGNFVSEWFGHRVYPIVVSTPQALADQREERCPFLSLATGEDRECIKKGDTSKGVCTINSLNRQIRQDWLVCPYRALSPELVNNAIRQLFGAIDTVTSLVLPAATLGRADSREKVTKALAAGQRVFIYFDAKMGGELSIPATPRSPEFAFDVTIVEIVVEDGRPHIGRFGFLEIQTVDFHGSYRAAVKNLRDLLRLHGEKFGSTLEGDQHWLSEGVQSPNIANVFKRTFYQMMFKFQLGQHARCAGCVLAIPQAVWNSWQRHLGAPELTSEHDGTFSLFAPDRPRPALVPAWIYVFDTDARPGVTPSPIMTKLMIATDAPSMSYWALDVAPQAALANIDSDAGFLVSLTRRLMPWWPELAKTITL